MRPKLSVKLEVMLMISRKNSGRRDQRQLQVEHAAERPRAIHGAGLDDRARDHLQRGEEEDEVVADVFPGIGEIDDHRQRLDAVDRRVPDARPDLVDRADEARLRREDEAEGNAGGGRRDGIGPDIDRLEELGALERAIDEGRPGSGPRPSTGPCVHHARRSPSAGDGRPVVAVAEDGEKLSSQTQLLPPPQGCSSVNAQ